METELFVHFAEIAGVFVGFGALISQRSVRPSDPHDVVYLRAVLALGVLGDRCPPPHRCQSVRRPR